MSLTHTSSALPAVQASHLGPARLVEDADLDALMTSHGAVCFRLARRLLRDAGLAQDVVQEAFFEHWRSGGFDPTRSTPRVWLLMLTHRKAVDRVRHEQRRTYSCLEGVPEKASPRRGPEDAALARLLAPKVHAALATLPSVQQTALSLAYWGGYTQREIAEITRTPLGTVKTRMRSGMISLRHALRDERDEVW